LPTYSYKCTECGTAFDIQQAFTDDSLTVCPNCGGKLRKVFTAVGVTFNGSGFYRNDARDAKKSSDSEQKAAASGKSEKAAKSAGSPGTAGSSGSSESSGGVAAKPAQSSPAASPTKTAG
jgi:putative FmdB family regulatory protein